MDIFNTKGHIFDGLTSFKCTLFYRTVVDFEDPLNVSKTNFGNEVKWSMPNKGCLCAKLLIFDLTTLSPMLERKQHEAYLKRNQILVLLKRVTSYVSLTSTFR